MASALAKLRRESWKSAFIGKNLHQGRRLHPRQLENGKQRCKQRREHRHGQKLDQLQRENVKRQPPAERLHVHDGDQAPRYQEAERQRQSKRQAISATDMVFNNSIIASRRRVIPMAHSGASCGRRELPSVSRLVSNATPATPRVKAFNAAVTAKVRLKIRFDLGLQHVAWSARLRPSSPNLV